MGSLQQSILGVFCIAAAFLLGQYMRNHPSPESLDQQRLEQAAAVPAPSFGFGDTNSQFASESEPQSKTRLPSPADGFGKTAETSKRVLPTAPRLKGSRIPAREIDVPDFSKLAASFKNTPLELPGTSEHVSVRPKPNVRSGSFYIRAAEEPKRVDRSVRNEYATNRLGQPAFAGSRPEAVAPPRPMEVYEVKDERNTFRREDFKPSLITEETSRRNLTSTPTPAAVRPKANRISLAPPEPDGPILVPEIPELEIVVPNQEHSAFNGASNQTVSHIEDARSNKRVHSYYDGVTTDSGLARSDFQQPAETSQVNSRRIPFGLNERGKRELARIQARQRNSSVSLQTDRFAQHTTRQGDTLQSLSIEYYGKPDFYLDIYLANQQVLRTPAVIPAGIQLRIPRYE